MIQIRNNIFETNSNYVDIKYDDDIVYNYNFSKASTITKNSFN